MPIPFGAREIKENITISTKAFSNRTKEKTLTEGLKAHSAGNILEAIEHYKFYINQGWMDPRIFCNYGVILQDKGETDKAIEIYYKSINLFPDYANSYSNLATIFKRQKGDLDKAEKFYRKAIELMPNCSDTHLKLGKLLKEKGETKQAKKFFMNAIKLSPKSSEGYYYLSLIYSLENDYVKAKIEIQSAIQNEPENHVYQGELSRIKFLLNENDNK